jgi:hypothetical protein
MRNSVFKAIPFGLLIFDILIQLGAVLLTAKFGS